MKKELLKFNDFKIGDQEILVRNITEEDVNIFGKLSGDLNPLHINEDYAKGTPFKRRVVHGLFVGSLISTTHTNFTGPGFVYVTQELNFKGPVFIGDSLNITLTLKDKKENKAILICETVVINQHDKIVLQGQSALMELDNLSKRKDK